MLALTYILKIIPINSQRNTLLYKLYDGAI